MGSGEPISPKNAPPDVHILAEDSALQSATVIRIDKLLAVSGLADSASDGGRKVKQGAVEIENETISKPKLAVPIPARPLVVRVGRSIKQVGFTYAATA